MPNTRHGHEAGKPARPRGSPATIRARERIAAERAAQRRAGARRRFLLPIAAVTAVLAFAGALFAVKLSSAPATAATASQSPASSAVARQVTTVPAAALTRVNPGHAATPVADRASGRAAADHRRQASDRLRQRRVLPVLRGRTLAAGRRAGPLRHLEPARLHKIIGRRHLPGHRHALVPHGALPQRRAHAADDRADGQRRAAPAGPHPGSTPSSSAPTTSPPTSTAPASPAQSRSSTSPITTSWPGRNTTRRYSPACPQPRSPASCATHRARSRRQSTDPPR